MAQAGRRDVCSCVREAALLAISPDGHTDDDRIHAAFELLRTKAAVCWIEPPGMRPFWLVSRHADVVAVERQGVSFIAAPRSVLSSEAGDASMRQISGKPDVLRSLFQMDDPEHRAYRDIALPWFIQNNLSGLESWIADQACETVERIAGRSDAFDFMMEVAAPFPMRVMMHILGLPPADDALILKLVCGLTGAEDPVRALSDRPAESIRLAGTHLRDYFNRVTAERRKCPGSDLSSAIANPAYQPIIPLTPSAKSMQNRL